MISILFKRVEGIFENTGAIYNNFYRKFLSASSVFIVLTLKSNAFFFLKLFLM